VTKSSNHTLSLHRLTSKYSSTNFLWPSPTNNWLNSQFQFSNLPNYKKILVIYRSTDPMENIVFPCRVLCYPAMSCSTFHKEHSSYFCVFVGMCMLSRCPATVICITLLPQGCSSRVAYLLSPFLPFRDLGLWRLTFILVSRFFPTVFILQPLPLPPIKITRPKWQ
jgi:hypothetical protein